MVRNFFKYVTWEERLDAKQLTANVFAYAASKQFVTPTGRRKVGKGDVIWNFTVPPLNVGKGRSGRLCLCGRLTVMDEVTNDKSTVARHIGANQDALYGARDAEMYYALADLEGAEDYVEICREGLAADIRFESPNDRLTLVGGLISEYNQLRALRPLTPETVTLLKSLMPIPHAAVVGRLPLTDMPQNLALAHDITVSEGRAKLTAHYRRERNRTVVRLAKQRFKERCAGRLFCEVCGFDYSEGYGSLGEGFIEAHHRMPLSELKESTLTRIVDLAMVCANCHRMLHRRTPWLTVEELREIVQGRAA